MLASDALRGHFEDNPRDLAVLQVSRGRRAVCTQDKSTHTRARSSCCSKRTSRWRRPQSCRTSRTCPRICSRPRYVQPSRLQAQARGAATAAAEERSRRSSGEGAAGQRTARLLLLAGLQEVTEGVSTLLLLARLAAGRRSRALRTSSLALPPRCTARGRTASTRCVRSHTRLRPRRLQWQLLAWGNLLGEVEGLATGGSTA